MWRRGCSTRSRCGDSFLVDYRLPRSIDPERSRFSARVDEATFEQAEATDALLVRAVPGNPAANRPAGEISSNLFAVVAIIGDLVLLLVGVALYRRWRKRLRFAVASVDGDEATLDTERGPLTVAGPPGWAARLQPRARTSAAGFTSSPTTTCCPDARSAGSSRCSVRRTSCSGRVLDTRAGRVVLELDDGFRLRVETGQHRIRADIRDPTEVRARLLHPDAGVNATPLYIGSLLSKREMP